MNLEQMIRIIIQLLCVFLFKRTTSIRLNGKKPPRWILEELRKLLKNEFRAIRRTIIIVYDETLSGPDQECANCDYEDPLIGLIFINWKLFKDVWMKERECPESYIIDILQHELLHIELNKDDDDPEFISEAIDRLICCRGG